MMAEQWKKPEKLSKVIMHIPIHTEENLLIRDAVARRLATQCDEVILEYVEHVKDVDGVPRAFPMSRLNIYVSKITDANIEFFKRLAMVVSSVINEPIVLEITKESSYIATAEYITEE
jgi:hypothetical protein